MIKLTLRDNKAVYIVPERIVGVFDGGNYTTVDTGDDEAYAVTESPEEVAHKVLEYRLAMNEHRALCERLHTSDCDDRLRALAGLETRADRVANEIFEEWKTHQANIGLSAEKGAEG